jgi:inhibitor of KinA sporulation pathway (predicted exonuclease)
MLIGKWFADLREAELRILYAWELWGDGMDLGQIFNEMNWNMKTEALKIPLVEVHQQLKNTFGYTDNEIIKG